MTIGSLARLCGVNVETIRYYQRRGLLVEPPKPPAGIRRYSQDMADRLSFIKRAQELGFSLAEIEELLNLGGHACAETRDRAVRKRTDIARRVQGLLAMGDLLDQLIGQCEQEHEELCPLYKKLAQ